MDSFETWRAGTSLRLTRTESEFVDRSVALRVHEETDRLQREAKEATLARRARRRLVYFGGAVALLAAAVTTLVMVLIPEPAPDLIVWFDGRGDASYGDLIGSGIDVAVEDFDLEVLELAQGSDAPEIEELVARGTGLVLLDTVKIGAFDDPLYLPTTYPETTFVLLDCSPEFLAGPMPANAACIATRNEEVGFVAGVAAGLATAANHVGMIGGVETEVIHEFHDGFLHGVAWVDPSIVVDVVYLTGFDGFSIDFSGFASPTLARVAAMTMYQDGADVVFHAAGASASGLSTAAEVHSATSGSHVWSIGVDVDEYYAMEGLGWFYVPDPASTLPRWREHLLTSALKRLNLGVEEVIRRHVSTGEIGQVILEIANGGIGYSTSGGYMDAFAPEMEAAMRAVSEGSVEIIVDYEKPLVFLADLLADS